MMTFRSVSRSEAEDFGDDWDAEVNFGKAFKGAGGAAQKHGPQVLSGAAQGAATGSAFGPWGTALGAGLGVAQSVYSAANSKGSGGKRPAVPSPPVAAGPPAPMPAPTASPGAPAASRLMQLLSSPALQQAIQSATEPGAASPTVPVGGATQTSSEVPVGALLALLGSLAGQAADEAESFSSDDSYLRGADGGYRCDPAVEAERHELLLELIADAETTDEPELGAEAWLVSALRR